MDARLSWAALSTCSCFLPREPRYYVRSWPSSFSALFRNTAANSSRAVFTYHSLALLKSSTHSSARCRYSLEVGMEISPGSFSAQRPNERTRFRFRDKARLMAARGGWIMIWPCA
jgi:hypothetical protein